MFDREHSDSLLYARVMKENAARKAAGRLNSMPNSARKQSTERANKSQRTMGDSEDLENLASCMHVNVSTLKNLQDVYLAYSGKSASCPGAPLYGNMSQDLPPGALNTPLKGHPTLGTEHPLGPEWALNSRRPDNLPLRAGLVDQEKQMIEVHPDQLNWRSYCGPNWEFRVPDIVKGRCGFMILTSPYVKTPFDAPLPFEVHGSLKPDDCLLKLFYREHKLSDPILMAARARTPDAPDTWEQYSTEVLSAVVAKMTERDRIAEEITRAISASQVMGVDSIDLSSADRSRLRSYGSSGSRDENGEQCQLEPREALKEMSIEVNRLHDVVDQWRRRQEAAIEAEIQRVVKVKTMARSTSDYFRYNAEEDDNYATARRMRLALAEELKEYKAALVNLALKKYQSCFQSKYQRLAIPGGWRDLYDNLVKEVSVVGRTAVPGSKRLSVDPSDPNACAGTLNLAFALDINMVTDKEGSEGVFAKTPWGAWQTFKMDMFSNVACIDGRETRPMTDLYIQAVSEPVNKRWSTMTVQFGMASALPPCIRTHELNYFRATIVPSGIGKSVRAKRLKRLMPPGMVIESGDGSEKAGRNGGFDDLCGRLVYFDEATQEMSATQQGPRIEYIKQKLSDNAVQLMRTVKVTSIDGVESFKTMRYVTWKFDADALSTNLGPGFSHGDDEPSDSRIPLLDRTQACLVFNTTKNPVSDSDFEAHVSSKGDELKRFRVVTLLVSNVILLIQDLPWLKPNFEFAKAIFLELDERLSIEYNFSPPTPRKAAKRELTLLMFAVEERVVEKFVFKQSACDFEDMRPDDEDHLESFDILQLADVVLTLHPSMEVIMAAWSHGLDYNPATASHTFHVMTQVAEAHGVLLNLRSDRDAAEGDPSSLNVQPIQGDAVDQHAAVVDARNSVFDAAAARAGVPEFVEPRDPLQLHAPQQQQQQPQQPSDVPEPEAVPVELAVRITEMLQTSNRGLTREQVRNMAKREERRRLLRIEYMRRGMNSEPRRGHDGEIDEVDAHVCKVLKANFLRNRFRIPGSLANDIGMHPDVVAGYIFPDMMDVLMSGYDQKAITEWVNGRGADCVTDERFGTTAPKDTWAFLQTSSGATPTAAAFDPSWRVIKTTKGVNVDKDGKEKRWMTASNTISSCKEPTAAMIRDFFGFSKTAIRDILFMISRDTNRLIQCVSPNDMPRAFAYDEQMHICKYNAADDEELVAEKEYTGSKIRPKGAGIYRDPILATTEGEVRINPAACGVDVSSVQRRVNWLISHGCLPGMAPLMGTTISRGPVLYMSSHHGLVVNSHALLSHVRFVIECALKVTQIAALKNRQGVVDGGVPTCFMSPKVDHSASSERQLEREAAASKRIALSAAARKASKRGKSAAGGRVRDEDDTNYAVEDQEPLAGLSAPSSPVASHNQRPLAPGSPPLNVTVNHPDDPTRSHARPHPGVGENQEVAYDAASDNYHYLAWSFDLNSICLTFSMMERFFVDAGDQIYRYSTKYPGILAGSVEDVYNRVVPAFTTRFADFQTTYYSKLDSRTTCMPLTCKLGCKQTGHSKDVTPKFEISADALEGLRAYASEVSGKHVRADDAAVTQLMQQQRRGKEVSGAIGNLYGYSSWSTHMVAAMLQRGVAATPNDSVIERLLDCNLCLRLTVRHQLGNKEGSQWNSLLRGGDLPEEEGTAEQVSRERAAVTTAHNEMCANFHRKTHTTPAPDELADRRLSKRHRKAMARPIVSIAPVGASSRDDVPAQPAP